MQKVWEVRAKQHEAAMNAVHAMRRVSARVIHGELARWGEVAHKQWAAQQEVVGRHGLPLGGPASPPRLLFLQMRRSGIGNLVGIIVPVLAFGGEVVENGLTLPLIWIVAVAADVAGKTVCMRATPVARAALAFEPIEDPGPLVHDAHEVLEIGRNAHDWRKVSKVVTGIRRLDSDLRTGDRALRNTRTTGKHLTVLAVTLVGLTQLVAAFGPRGQQVTAWLTVVSALVGVFGASTWMAAATYTEAMDRPPFLRPMSVQAFLKSIRVEQILVHVRDEAFVTADAIRNHSTKEMLRQRPLVAALKDLDRAELQLNRSVASMEGLLDVRRPSVNTPPHSERSAQPGR